MVPELSTTIENGPDGAQLTDKTGKVREFGKAQPTVPSQAGSEWESNADTICVVLHEARSGLGTIVETKTLCPKPTEDNLILRLQGGQATRTRVLSGARTTVVGAKGGTGELAPACRQEECKCEGPGKGPQAEGDDKQVRTSP